MSPSHPNRSRHAPSPARNPRPEEIRAARAAAGLTQTAAAALVYRTLRGWQDIEAGVRPMDPAIWELWQIRVRERRTVQVDAHATMGRVRDEVKH